MSEGQTPFTVFEAEVALWTVDSAGETVSEVFIGGCSDRISLEDPFREMLLETHGESHRTVHHEDDEHFITIRNVRTLDRGTSLMPQLRKQTKYIFVIVWWDPDELCWCKRSYFGVTAAGGPAVDDLNIEQTIRLRAEELVEFGGLGSKPDLEPVRTGEVVYISGSERVALYSYDTVTDTFAALDASLLTGRATIVRTGSDMTISIGGTEALHADATDVKIGELVGVGGTFLNDTPRLEFWLGSQRCASLSVARLAAPAFEERATQPTLARAIEGLNTGGGWLFSLGTARTYGKAFTERAA